MSFDIRIKIRYSQGGIGLGSVGYYVGLTNIEEKFINTEDPNVKNYETIVLRIICEAKFHFIRSWSPPVVRYKEWAQSLFDDLYNTFDWSICQTKMKNYQEALSNQKIINKLK